MSTEHATGEQQRAERRRLILATTARLLGETPVAQLTIKQVGREVGLATSNVLRYFESREAILLDLLDAEQAGWAAELNQRVAPVEAPLGERASRLATALASTLAERPVLCDLLSARSSVLERDISVHVLLRHRYAAADVEDALVPVLRRLLPELDPAAAHRLIALTALATSAVWPHSRPSRSLLAVHATDPQLARDQRSFADGLAETVELTARGLLARAADR